MTKKLSDDKTPEQKAQEMALYKMLEFTNIKLDDMPEQMTKEDYATVFARVITPEMYVMVLGACVGKAVAGNMKAIEIIMNQAQGVPTPREEAYSPQEDALLRLQQAVMLAGVKVNYTVDG